MRSSVRRTPMALWLLVGLMAFSGLLLGCNDEDDEVENLHPRDLQNRTFVFADGRAFDLPGQPVTLAFGAFGLEGQPRLGTVTLTRPGTTGSATGRFFVEEDGNVFESGVDLNPASECDLEITASTLPGVPVGKQIHFDPCGFDEVTGALRLENDATNQVSIANP